MERRNRYLLFFRAEHDLSSAEIALVTFYNARSFVPWRERDEKKREREGEKKKKRDTLHYGATYYRSYFLHDSTLVSAKAEHLDPICNCVLRRWCTIQQCDRSEHETRKKKNLTSGTSFSVLRVRVLTHGLSLYHSSQCARETLFLLSPSSINSATMRCSNNEDDRVSLWNRVHEVDCIICSVRS